MATLKAAVVPVAFHSATAAVAAAIVAAAVVGWFAAATAGVKLPAIHAPGVPVKVWLLAEVGTIATVDIESSRETL